MSPLTPYQFTGGTAVLTGAASGMGEQLAYGLAARGSHLVLIDRDAGRLAAVAERIRRGHPRLEVDAVMADLSDISGLPSVAEGVLAARPRITLLINNAGVALGGRFAQVSAEEFDWVMNVNFRAPVVLTRLLLPRLLAAPGGHIVNVSSLFGLVAPAGQVAYSASKFALRGFSEALRHELAGHGVGVTTVHPGGVRTRIAENARVAARADARQVAEGKRLLERLLTYPPDKAAERILAGVRARRPRVLISASAVALDALARLLPASHLSLLYRLRPSAR